MKSHLSSFISAELATDRVHDDVTSALLGDSTRRRCRGEIRSREQGVFSGKTVCSVFDQVRLYGDFALASDMPMQRNEERQKALMGGFSPEEKTAIGQNGPYLGDQEYVRGLTAGYPVNEDWKPVCEYYLRFEIADLWKRLKHA